MKTLYKPTEAAFYEYFSNQAGSGFSPYESIVNQRGRGLGSFIAKIGGFLAPVLTKLLPVAKTVGKAALTQAASTAINTAADLVDGKRQKTAPKPLKRVLQKQTSRFLRKQAKKLKQKGDGIVQKRRKSAKIGYRKINDIFT